MKTSQTISHVFDICNSAHTAIGVFIEDATDRSKRAVIERIDRRPLVEKIVRASDGYHLFTHSHGLHCGSTWTDDRGCVLEQFEEPTILPVEHFYAMFGGSEYCGFR